MNAWCPHRWKKIYIRGKEWDRRDEREQGGAVEESNRRGIDDINNKDLFSTIITSSRQQLVLNGFRSKIPCAMI